MSPQRRSPWELLALNAVALFLELAIIRWLSSEIRIFAYFKNLPLMAAFLEFGVGFFLADKSEKLFLVSPRLLGCLVIVIAGAAAAGITHVIFVDPRQYFLLGTGFGDHALDPVPSLLQTLKALFVIVSIFFLVVAAFATFTAKIGALINREQPLRGYSINVLGSLVGVVCFSYVSYLEWPPFMWLAVLYFSLLYFYRHVPKLAAAYFSATLVVTVFMAMWNPAIWSPYYRVAVAFETNRPDRPFAAQVLVNYDGFQLIENLSRAHLGQFPESLQRSYNRHYNNPYRLRRKPIKSVLILGGGTGNDAAAALRHGATFVDVVEIDPAIARLGRDLHPEKPYSSRSVRLHVDDVRSFLQKTARKYDLIVFATLDSHTAFSSLSSLRLDNFVFTRESVQRTAELLNPGGGIAINFFATKPWLSQRHFNTLRDGAGGVPLAYASPNDQEVLLLAGALFDPHLSPGVTDYHPISTLFTDSTVESTTDDWPFLFLEQRGIPFHYSLPLFLIFALSWVPVRYCRLDLRSFNWQLFFMGAAFLLIETKAVTALGLILGSTWMINSIVIGAILIMILLANVMVTYQDRFSFLSLYLALSVVLGFNFIFPFRALNQLEWTSRVLAGGAIVASPLFIAAIVFAKAFAVVRSPSDALASNLFGALVGGLLEYLDMWTGLRSLNLVALGFYLASAAALMFQRGIGFPRRAKL